jgi:hypothetical protein
MHTRELPIENRINKNVIQELYFSHILSGKAA